jgi:glyoxylase-like metal-dependent hydrolase (beta-lactamase superfamily II)
MLAMKMAAECLPLIKVENINLNDIPLNRSPFILDLFLRAAFVMVLFPGILFPGFSQGGNPVDEAERFITSEHLGDRVLQVRLGVDAITAIATQKGIVVIDAGISNTLTSIYREIIEKEFHRNDFAYLINTHCHADHTGGNQVFSDAVIVGNEHCQTDLSEEWKDPEKRKSSLAKIIREYEEQTISSDSGSTEWIFAMCQKIRYRHAYNDLFDKHLVTLPTLTFQDGLEIPMGDVQLDLIYFGKAHSGSDILIHIPELKLLFTGDLFFPRGIPSIGAAERSDVQRWMESIQWLKDRRDEIDMVIGGHGEVMNREDLEMFIHNMERKWEEVNSDYLI